VLLLEDLTDPDSIGSLFRSSWALGADAVVLTDRCTDPLYRKAIRTSMGAVFDMPYARCATGRSGVEALRRAGFVLAALTPHTDAESPERPVVQMAGRLALLVGTEGRGLTEAVLSAADLRLRIPLRRGVDSLNVSVAAAVALATLRPLRPSAPK
jgi:tRNA G18 (ribose-2'-O)-methylase SpoU